MTNTRPDSHTDRELPRPPLVQLISTAGAVLAETIGEVEVAGTISGFKRRRRYSYARLITHQPNSTQPVARLPLAFSSGLVRPGVDLNGASVVVTGRMSAHLLYGPVQFSATRILVVDQESPATQTTRELRDAIRRDQLDQVNKRRALRYDADRLGVICPIGRGAGGADVFHRLNTGPHDWDLTEAAIPMGGPTAAYAIARAITQHSHLNLDALLVCRGGGAPSDMAPFDSEVVANAIVQSPIPVVVAVGHATDSHIADLVAHTTLPTPTAAADWFNRQRNTAAIQAAALVTKAVQASAVAHQSQAIAAERVAERARCRRYNRRHAPCGLLSPACWGWL